MKRTPIMAAATAILALFCGCDREQPAALKRKPEGRILIVCYSESANRNTLTAAELIRSQVGGDLVEIRMVKPYGSGYRQVLKESKHHLDNGIKPEIQPLGKNAADYDVIFIGSPVWYGTFAPPVGTVLAQNDLSGKNVIPFCTHGGGGAGHLYDDLAKAAPGAKILPGLTLRGSNVVERTIGRGTKDKVKPHEIVERLNEIL